MTTINVGLIRSQDEIIALMQGAGWQKPVPVTLRSNVRIDSVALHHAYYNAHVSTLIYLGRHQDLAFKNRSAGMRGNFTMCVFGSCVMTGRTAVPCGWVQRHSTRVWEFFTGQAQ